MHEGKEKNEPVKIGMAAWATLNNKLLSAEGKAIVNKDPDLSDKTVEKLLKLLPEDAEKHEFYLSSDAGSDIGLAVVSMCIKDDLNSTMAEVVGRYCDYRGVSFAETAAALNELKKTNGLFYYVRKKHSFSAVNWEPRLDNCILGRAS